VKWYSLSTRSGVTRHHPPSDPGAQRNSPEQPSGYHRNW